MRFVNFIAFVLIIFNYSTIYAQDDYTSNKNPITTINADPGITKLLKARFGSSTNNNYKIQLYYGSLNKAHEVLNKFDKKYKKWEGKIEYETPNYKVWVGNYLTRIEADKALMEISKNFPHAFIFKPEK